MGAFLLAVLTTAMIGGSDAGAAFQFSVLGGESPRVIESSHRIEFPNRIVFNLEAEAPPGVKSAQLRYNVAARNVEVYVRPTAFANSETLEAEFVVNTGASGFIPQGVDIEYYYVFTDSEGTRTESDRFVFQYLDPRRQWMRLEQNDYTLLWHDRSERSVERVAADVSARLPGVKRLFGLEGDYDFRAVVVNDQSEANLSSPSISRAAHDAQLYGGFAFTNYGALMLNGLNRDGLMHELVHLMMDEALDSPRAREPAWLSEGLAMYFEPNAERRDSQTRSAWKAGRLIPLANMESVPGRPDDVRLFYSQSALIVRFLMDRYGEDRMAALLRYVNEGRDVDAALRAAYGFGLEELDDRWRADFRGNYSFTDFVDPGTFGTSALIGGAMLITSTVLLIRWLKRLRQPPVEAEDELE